MINKLKTIQNEDVLKRAVSRYRDRGIILPTFEQQRNPDKIPAGIKVKLKNTGLWDLDPINLFRITWKNEPIEKGGLYGKVNFLEIPKEISGVNARIVLILGKYFPTGAHKVGAAYGCLVPRIITGQFDPTYHKAVWPSTGNYCRGGAFDSKIMGSDSVAILPENMSRERFEWLRDKIGSEVIATPGCESNVKEIYDKCWEIKATRPECIILNQFEEFGNAAWHYNVTGPALEEVFGYLNNGKGRLSAYISSTGSAGTIAGGDYLRTKFPHVKIVATEALQCPTLLMNGFGDHRIEGIGDKHVPWIHNVKNTDLVAAIDDEDCMRIFRLLNESKGIEFLKSKNIDSQFVSKMSVLGISGISNILSAIKTARYFEMDENDVVLTIATDSADMYQSRLQELNQQRGEYSLLQAALDYEKCLIGQNIAHLKELTYSDKKSIHNLKYFTWVEQQQKPIEELNQLWYDNEFWPSMFHQADDWDKLIIEFNERTGLLKKL
jgi:cysteine synthase